MKTYEVKGTEISPPLLYWMKYPDNTPYLLNYIFRKGSRFVNIIFKFDNNNILPRITRSRL